MTLHLHFKPAAKMNSKWSKTITIKLLEETTGAILNELGFGNGFLDMTQKQQATTTK